MAGESKGDRPQPREVAAYVATMAGELKDLVEPYKMRSLVYLLDLVRLEAEERAGADRMAEADTRDAS